MEYDMKSDVQDVDYDDSEEDSLEEEENESDEGQFEEVDNDSDDGHQSEDEDEDEEEEEDEEVEKEGGEEEDEAKKNSELAQLEKEYKDLQHQEQDILKNLKQHKDDDLLKGQSVKSQLALWDRTLELRFLLQKAFSSSNRLPQEPIRTLYCDLGDGVSEAYSELVTTATRTLDSMAQLQEALLETNSSIAQSAEAISGKKKKRTEDSAHSSEECDDEWTQISQMHSRMASFRNESIDRWQKKTQVTTGAAGIRGKLQAFNKNISEQVATYMRDPSKMIKGMQQSRSAVGVFGSVLDSTSSIKTEETMAEEDVEFLDDSDFYQYLLKEFFESVDPSSSEMAFYAHRRLKPKKRKLVDRRASKSRKIRYNVHEKIVNFMAPQPMDVPPMAPKLFENLFGLKTKNPANAA